MKFPVNIWTKFISHIVKVPVDKIDSGNEPLYVDLIKGRYQLSTDKAVYSFDDKYDNFVTAFRSIKADKFNQKNILVLGGGLGSVPFILEKNHSVKANFTIVEYDLNVIKLFNKYTRPRLESDVTIVETDAEYYMLNNSAHYDMIVIDLFIDDEIPEKFTSHEFLEICKEHLSEKGLLLYNCMTVSEIQKIHSADYKKFIFDVVFKKHDFVKTKYNYVLMGVNENTDIF